MAAAAVITVAAITVTVIAVTAIAAADSAVDNYNSPSPLSSPSTS